MNPEKISPIAIQTKEFKKSAFGYSPREVVDFLEKVAKQLERMQQHEAELMRKLSGQAAEITRWQAREKELDELKNNALKEAEMIRENANTERTRASEELEQRANQVREQTESWLAEVISEIEETERQRSNFMLAFRSALESHSELLKKNVETLSPLGNRLAKFLKKSKGGEIGNATPLKPGVDSLN